jgi:nickel-dependent lactate racemase
VKVKIPYGKSSEIDVEIPPDVHAEVIYPNEVHIGDEKRTLEDALSSPLESPSLDEFLSGPGKTVFVVNDGTRPTPTERMLEAMHASLEGADVDFLVATGVHRAPTEEEYRFIFGRFYDEFRDRIFYHDARDDSAMERVGTTRSGLEVKLNRRVVDADRLILTSSVEPHYFAGLTGGRKSILPGVAAYSTVEGNHRFALDPRARSLALDGNPVHDTMMETMERLDRTPIFSFQTVLDKHKRVYAAFAGALELTFRRAVDKALEVFSVEVDRTYGVVVTCAPYPMDIDLYQSQKALENGKLILRDGGVIILVSQCWDGIGERAFYDLLSSAEDPEAVFRRIERGYKLGYHKAAKLVDLMRRAKLWASTDLPDEDLKRIFLRPVSDPGTAIEEALALVGTESGIAFLIEGSVTVPRVRAR